MDRIHRTVVRRGIPQIQIRDIINFCAKTDRGCQYIDSLGYLSVEGMCATVPTPKEMCTACFTGEYPTEVPVDFKKEQFDTARTGAL